MSGHCDVELAAKPPQRTQQLHVAVVGSDSGVDVSSVARLLKQLLVQRDAPRDKASPHVAFVHVTSVSPAGTPFPLHRTRDGRRLSLTVMEEARKHMKQVERAKAVRAGGPLEDEAAGLASSQASSQGDDEGSLARKRRGVASAGNRRHRSNQPGGKEGSGRKGAAAEEPPLTPAQLEERQKFIETYLPLCELVNVAVHSPGAMEQMPGAPSTIPVLFVYELAEQAHLMQQLEEGVEDIDFAGAFWRTIASTLPSELTELSVVWAVPDARMLRAFRQEDPSRRAAGAKTEPAEPEDRRRATSSSNPKSASSSPSISNVASTTNLTSLPCLPMATLDPNVQRNLVPRVVLYVNESGFDVNLGDPHHHPSFEQSTSKRPGGRGSNAGGAKKSARKGNTGDGSRSSSRGAKAGAKPQKGGATPSPHDTPMCYYDPQRELVEQRLYATSTTFAQFIEKQQLFVHQRQQLQQQQRLYLPGFVDQCGRNPLYQKLILTVEEENALVNFSPGLENITSASTYGGTNPFSFSNACGAVTLHDRMASARDGRSGLSSWLSDGATILESHLTTDMCEVPSLSDLAVYNAAVSAELLERRSNSPPTVTADRRTSGGTIAEPPTRKAKLQIKHRRAVAEPVWATIMASQKDCLDEEWLSTCATTLVPALDQLVSITGSYHTWRQGHHLTVMPPTPAEEAWRRATGETGEGSAADAPLAGDAAAASAGAAGAAPIATTTSRSVSPTPSSPISPTNPATQPPVGTYQKGISPTDLRGARTMEDSVEVSPVNHTGLEIYDKQKRFNGEFTWTSAILALIAQATNHLAQQLPTMLVKPADPDIPLASLTVTLSQSAIARARSRSGPMEKSLSCLHMRSRCSSRVQSSDVGEPAQRLRLASRQPEDLVAGGADQSVYLGGADTATRLGDTMSAVRFRDIVRREVEDGTRVCQRPPLLRSYLGDALLATGDNTGTTSVLHGAEWLRRRTAMVHAARAKRATAVDAVISAAVAAAATAAAPSPRPANTRKASLKRGKKVKEEPSMASIATEADSTQAAGAEIRYVVPCDHALDRPQLRPQPQEINWLVEQYVKQAGGYFAYTKRGGDTVASTVAPHRLNSVSAAEETMGTIHSTHGNPSQYFQAVHRMRELRGGVFNGAGMYEAEGHVRQMLHSTIDANLRVVDEATILAGLGMVSRSPHETLDSSLSSMVDASAYCPLLPIRLLQRCTVPLSSVELKLQCAVERSLTRREREHILQQTILLALARTAHLLPDPPGGDQRQPIPSLVEEVVTMVVMYNRLQQFLRRYGAHLCSLLSFQPGSSSNAATLPLPRSPAKKAAAAAMNSTSPPRNHTGSTKAPLRRTSVFSKSAENIFPPRRAEHFWVAGLEVPPMRRRRLLWLHPSAGVPSLSQFMGWRRLLEQLDQAEVEDCDRRTKLGEYLESPPPDATPDAIQTEVSAPFSLPIGDQPAFTTGMDASAAPVDPRAEQGLPASVVKGLLAKHLSQRNFYARPSQTPLPPFADYTHAEQLQLTAEGRQVMYPYCDAIVELVSTNYQRSCRYVKANELTATMHYNIPPFSASAEAAFLEAGGCLPLYEESIYAVMRFDDGVTFTITQNQSRRPPPPPVEPERSECASGRSPPSTPGIPQTPRSTGSRASVRRGSHSSVDRERVRKPARSSTVKGRRRTVKTESVVAVEQPTEVVLPLSSLVPPPIGPDGDVRLWTARLPLPPEKRAAMREVAAEAAQAQAAGTAILANSVTASCTRTSMSTSVGLTAAAAAAASAAAAGSAAPPVLVDPTIPNTKRQVHPLDITITTNNFVLHRKQEEHLLWCTSHSTEDSTMHYAGPTHYAFASLESIAGVHVYDGEKSAVVTSMERESTRSVDEASGIVTRYFESGSMQVLFPNGAVLVRYREPARTASLYRSAGHVDPRAPHGDLDPSSGMLGRGPRLLDPNAGNRFCETLTTPSGAQFVRCVTEEEKTGHHGDPWRHVRQPRRMSPFMRLTAVATVEVQRSYDAMHHCLMTSRQDGVSTVFYYRKGGSNGRMQATETMMSYTTDRAFVAMVEAGFAGTMDSMQGDGGLAAESLDRINAYACVVLHADGTTITTFADGTALSATLPLGGTTATSHGGVTRLLDSTGAGMDEDDDEQWRSPVIAPLIAVAKAVSGECSATTRWCVESPRMPRFFLTAPSFARRDLRPSEEPEETVAIGRANNNNTTTNEGEGFDPSARRERGEGTTCFYVIFGDGTVLKRHVIARKARGTSVPFLETVLARSTKTSIRVIHENGLAVIEPMDAVVRNSRNVACLAVGEGFPMLDFAQGGFRLVDYQCHVTEVKGLYSPFGATVTMAPSTWEAQLQQLVSDTYTPHRIPKARQEEREERQRRAELADRQARLRGVCPSLLHRLRELAEPFIVKNNLLSPELLHNLRREHQERKRMALADALQATSKTLTLASAGRSIRDEQQGTAGATSATGNLTSTISPEEREPCYDRDGIAPVLFSKLTNGEVLEYMDEAKLHYVLQQQANSEFTPLYLSRSTASGEPGVRQLTLFRAGPAVPAKESPNLPRGRVERVAATPAQAPPAPTSPSLKMPWSSRSCTDSNFSHASVVVKHPKPTTATENSTRHSML